jgi:hypothetical protein
MQYHFCFFAHALVVLFFALFIKECLAIKTFQLFTLPKNLFQSTTPTIAPAINADNISWIKVKSRF